jgi:hypothetical protein
LQCRESRSTDSILVADTDADAEAEAELCHPLGEIGRWCE